MAPLRGTPLNDLQAPTALEELSWRLKSSRVEKMLIAYTKKE